MVKRQRKFKAGKKMSIALNCTLICSDGSGKKVLHHFIGCYYYNFKEAQKRDNY